ncbi:MAG: hypothetical protein M0031_13400 [Thermaerobacter sp.]|nr:hypothetical protein [Thermaerobacter sp.]
MLRMACGYRRFLPYLQVAVPVLLFLSAQLRRQGQGGGTGEGLLLGGRSPVPR